MPDEKGLVDAALKMASPELFRRNAFRLLGLPAGASQQQVTRRRQELALEAKLGGGEDGGGAAGMVLPVVPPPDEDALREAARRLRDPEGRFLDELFWPWPLRAGAGPDEGLLALEHGDVQGAIAAWELASETPEGGVASHNLAVVYHLMVLDIECLGEREALSKAQVKQKQAYWLRAVGFWRKVCDDDGFWAAATARAQRLRDPRLDGEAVAALRAGLPEVLLGINARLAARAAQAKNAGEARWHADLVRGANLAAEAAERALVAAAGPARDAVKALCAASDQKVEAAPGQGGAAAGSLMDAAVAPLAVLDALLPPDHQVLAAVRDEIVLKVLHLQIAYAKATDDWALSLELLKRALSLARGSEAKKRLGENITIVENNLRLSQCWFCGKRPAEDSAAVHVSMCKVTGRIPIPGGTRVQYQKVRAAVPRCGQCRAIHKRAKAMGCLGAALGFILVFGGFSIVSSTDGWWEWVGLALTGLGLVGGAVVAGAGSRSARRSGTKPEASKMDSPGIKKLKADGFVVGDSPAN